MSIARNRLAEDLRVPLSCVWMRRRRSDSIRAHEWHLEFFAQRLCGSCCVWEDLRKYVVERLNQRGLRAEVGGELERFQRYIPQPPFCHGPKKSFYACLAKKVDRLLRIPNEEDRLRVAVPRAR